MKKSVMAARIRVLESDLELVRARDEMHREGQVRAESALRETGEVLATITARAIKEDKGAVGGWFAWLIISTPTLILLAEQAKGALEANVEALRHFDAWTLGRGSK